MDCRRVHVMEKRNSIATKLGISFLTMGSMVQFTLQQSFALGPVTEDILTPSAITDLVNKWWSSTQLVRVASLAMRSVKPFLTSVT